MTYFVANYDTEMSYTSHYKQRVPTCLEACRRIVELHLQQEIPATFSIVGKALASAPDEYRRLLDHPLFEIASHTWSHQLPMDRNMQDNPAEVAKARQEIFDSKKLVEDVFGRKCLGLRMPGGSPTGLKGQPRTLGLIAEAGYQYISSYLWGEDYSLPAPLTQSFTYAEEGFPNLIEMPGHGWHENLIKGNNAIFGMRQIKALLFPQPFPEAIPNGFVKTPAEEFQYNNKAFIDRAIAGNLPFVSLIWHPWSMGMFDPTMEMLEMTFQYVKEKGLTPATYQTMSELFRRSHGSGMSR